MHWFAKQSQIARALVLHRRVLVRAGNGPGKTFLAGGLVNWFFDCFYPGICLTTAPTALQVDDLLWKEVRTQRRYDRWALSPKSSRLESAENHFAVGYTSRDAHSFQGRHESSLFICFDEATGIDGQFFDAAEGMMTSSRCYWLILLNPLTTACRAYEEERSGRWHVITLSALDHPNIRAELAGRPAPYPAAVRLGWLGDRVEEWCRRIDVADRNADDVEIEGAWYRPGPLFEARVLGRWPTQRSHSVWSEAMWERALIQRDVPDEPTEIGCDVARFGDDFTSIVVRRGPCVLHHETHNGWDTAQTAGRLKQLAMEQKRPTEDPTNVRVKIDDDGVGGGVVDQAAGYAFVGVGAAAASADGRAYPNKRSEQWFLVAGRAELGELDLSRIGPESLALLRSQAMAPTWRLDQFGRRVVESKADTKKRLGRSPDDMDALNLAFAQPSGWIEDMPTRKLLLSRLIET